MSTNNYPLDLVANYWLTPTLSIPYDTGSRLQTLGDAIVAVSASTFLLDVHSLFMACSALGCSRTRCSEMLSDFDMLSILVLLFLFVVYVYLLMCDAGVLCLVCVFCSPSHSSHYYYYYYYYYYY